VPATQGDYGAVRASDAVSGLGAVQLVVDVGMHEGETPRVVDGFDY
jgi:hypothetical protein